ncbi:cytochrome c3 family protein [Agaribacter flavus]|uniref:nitrite reductase (cytochrome; ammonia-forming) n=1 Tax=Agaribacter flavus TaxID=1902781 RepID=A0ABV7FNX8_9ALTE
MKLKSVLIWCTWLLVALGLAGYLGAQMFTEEQKPDFLIGESSHGHYQIELQCVACHESPFGGPEVLQNACTSCHAEELKASHDSHPKSKFTDPRNADRLAVIDARQCIACHVEHNPEITHPMGVSLPEDFCFHCHQDIAEDRPSHQGMEFNTCASSGCHNYHDNRALYEEFLVDNAQGHWLHDDYQTINRDLKAYLQATGNVPEDKPQVKTQMNDAELSAMTDWTHSKHYESNIACVNCHGSEDNWLDKPPMQQCQNCHQQEFDGFTSGKHGMRLAVGMTPMTPAMSRTSNSTLSFHEANSNTPLTCNTCHNPHIVDVKQAAVNSCLSCHSDQHSESFLDSPHGQLWQAYENGQIADTEAVSCASCHMPRITVNEMGIDRVLVQHNQNAVLRPNEKMIRPVCMSCHSLAFSIDALADKTLIKNNFTGKPAKHIESIDMSLERVK